MNELTLFTPIKTELAALTTSARAIKAIATESQALQANLILKQSKAMENAAKSIKDTLKRPHIDANKMIDEQFNSLVKPMLDVGSHLKPLLISFNAQEEKRKDEEKRRLEEEKRVADEKRKLELARDVSPSIDDFDSLLLDDSDVARANIVLETNAQVEQFVADKHHAATLKALDTQAVKGVQKVWTFELIDEDQLPREFMVADESKIRKAVKEGRREIPGCKIWEADRMTVRA